MTPIRLLGAAALLLPLLSTTGCVLNGWPPVRGGGMAEMAPPERVFPANYEPGSATTTVIEDLAAAEAALDTLEARGAMRFAPGDTTIARKLTHRIRREIAGDLISEARKDLVELSDRLAMIDRRLGSLVVPGTPVTSDPAIPREDRSRQQSASMEVGEF